MARYRETVLWLITLIALVLAIWSLVAPIRGDASSGPKDTKGVNPSFGDEPVRDGPRLASPPSARTATGEHQVRKKKDGAVHVSNSVKKNAGTGGTEGVPFKELSPEEQERRILGQLNRDRQRFDAAFDANRADARSDWSLEKEGEFLTYVDGLDMGVAVEDATCHHAMCRADLEFDSEQEAQEFFSFDARDNNPWATGKLRAIRRDASSQRSVTIYAIPDKSRQSSWNLDDESRTESSSNEEER